MESQNDLDIEQQFERDEVFEFETTWQGIDLNVSYCPRWLCADGDSLITQHIAICSAGKVALPITETGYKSLFMNGTEALTEFNNNPVAYVLAWLDEAAKSKNWKTYIEANRQYSMFD